jgi:hypothetical protein
MENKKLPPKTVGALVFGILSVGFFATLLFPLMAFVLEDLISSGSGSPVAIVLMFAPSIIFAVISLSFAGRAEDAIKQHPESYCETRMLKAARITAYIGASISFLALIIIWIMIKAA